MGRRAGPGRLRLHPGALRPRRAAGRPAGGRARRPHRVDDGRRGRTTRGSRPRRRPARRALAGARWGTDIGWPQCGHALPDIDVDFTIIQVTSGRPGTVSPCLTEQVAWARSVRSVVNAYVVPGSPSAADLAAADRDGSCRGGRSCLLRAAGAADAAHALAGAEAAGLDARGWWLDIEDVAERTLWGTDTGANTQVLIGWRDELRRAGKQVGVYSTRGYWRQIVGHWQADLPQWPAVGLAGIDAAQRACGRPFTSGPVLITQWLTGPLDGNLLCPRRDRLAQAFFGHFARARTAGVPALLITPVPHPDIEAAQRAQAAREAEQAEAGPAGQGRGRRRGEEGQRAKATATRHDRAGADQAPLDARPTRHTPPPEPTPAPAEPAPSPAPAEPAPASPHPRPPPTGARHGLTRGREQRTRRLRDCAGGVFSAVDRCCVSGWRPARSRARPRRCRPAAGGRSWSWGPRSSRATGRSSRAAGRGPSNATAKTFASGLDSARGPTMSTGRRDARTMPSLTDPFTSSESAPRPLLAKHRRRSSPSVSVRMLASTSASDAITLVEVTAGCCVPTYRKSALSMSSIPALTREKSSTSTVLR